MTMCPPFVPLAFRFPSPDRTTSTTSFLRLPSELLQTSTNTVTHTPWNTPLMDEKAHKMTAEAEGLAFKPNLFICEVQELFYF